MTDLISIRKELDGIDAKIIDLLIKRDGLVDKVADYKLVNKLPIRDPQREAGLLLEKSKQSQGKLSEQFVRELFEVIIKHSCLKQEQILKRKI
jgi:chorismate mutase